MRPRLIAVAAIALVAAACAATPESSAVSTQAPIDTGDLVDPVVVPVSVDGVALHLALVDTSGGRSQGLRAVEDLGELDGMLFSWKGAETTSRFTMQDTLIPLDITFFAADGGWVDTLHMVPCTASPCPLYSAPGPYAYALEVPAGSGPAIGPGSTLAVEDLS